MYVHVHALALIRYIVIPVEQHVTELAALLPRLNPHFGSLCVKNTTQSLHAKLLGQCTMQELHARA